MRNFFCVLIISLFCRLGAGFVPPLSVALKSCFDGRKALPSVTSFQHEVVLRSGDSVAIEENLAEIDGKIYFSFRSANLGEVGGTWSKGTYTFAGDKKVFGKSRVFVSFFTMSKPESFREVLIEEKFVKRDQFSQYLNSWTPKGDPATWDIAANYVSHPDVVFTKIPSGIAVTAIGLNDGNSKRSVSFDKESLQLARLEWLESRQAIAWNFQNVKKMGGDGLLPSSLSMTLDNRSVVKTSVVGRELLKGKAKGQWLSKFSNSAKTSPSASFEEALRVLLDYR